MLQLRVMSKVYTEQVSIAADLSSFIKMTSHFLQLVLQISDGS